MNWFEWIQKYAWMVFVGYILVLLAILGCVGVVAHHFIAKYW